VGGSLTHAQWVNAIRRGLGPDGRSLRFMPAEAFQVMSDQDVGALVAYLERLPPVDHEVPRSRVGPLGRVIIMKGKSPLLTAEIVDHNRRPAARVKRGVTPEYGYYLARLGGCIGCHGRDLAGRRVPGAPASVPTASNLTPAGIGRYSEGDFIRALRDGTRPDGRPIDPFMPLSSTRRLTDDEIRAIYAYLRTVPAYPQTVSPRALRMR
jgi:cytochrome c553